MNEIYEKIEEINKRYSLYEIRRKEYQGIDNRVPFKISPEAYKLNKNQLEMIKIIGILICQYMKLVIQLYFENSVVKEILDKSKSSKFFLKNENPEFCFLRPDLIIDKNNNFKLCEIETSIFGLALADILNKCYLDCGIETLLPENSLKQYITSNIPSEGVIAYSKRVEAFKGQLKYLAENIFNWDLKLIDENPIVSENIYRAFYSTDYLLDQNIEILLTNNHKFFPSLTPQFEEKAIMSFLWDKRFTEFFKKNLGNLEYLQLKKIIPPTWIVGEEDYFELEMPNNVTKLSDIANLPKGKRKFVLKKSGNSSWGEGILFLHKISHERIKSALDNAINSNELFIIQEFNEAQKIKVPYLSANGILEMNAKIRITPYYGFLTNGFGKIIAIKATGCENTDYIHGASNSINTSVAS